MNLLGGFGEIFNVDRVPAASVSRKISARIESTKPSKTESRWCHDREAKAQTHLHSASKSNLTVSKSHHLTPFFPLKQYWLNTSTRVLPDIPLNDNKDK